MSSNKLLASVGGVCIASAVVIGAVLGASDGGGKTPAQKPVGNQKPIASTVTVTSSSARPAAITRSRAASSLAKPPASSSAVHHNKARRAGVNQEPAVTDPSTTPSDNSTLINQGPGTVDEGGIRRAPAPTGKHSAPPAPPAPPHAPSPS